MDLKDFVRESITQIMDGVQEAIDERGSKYGVINPAWNTAHQAIASPVEFDIAVTAVDKNEKGVNAGLKIWSVEFGGKGNISAENSTVSRIKFSIPIIPPVQVITSEDI